MEKNLKKKHQQIIKKNMKTQGKSITIMNIEGGEYIIEKQNNYHYNNPEGSYIDFRIKETPEIISKNKRRLREKKLERILKKNK